MGGARTFDALRGACALTEGIAEKGVAACAKCTQTGHAEAVERDRRLTILKSDDDKRLVFGWASVAVRVTGEEIVDWQEDIVEIEELEAAAYEYTAEFGTAGEMHERGGVGRLVESVVFTKEKAEAMGIPPEILPEGWWVGFHIDDGDVWEKVKNGTYTMFSIEGTAKRVEAI